MSSQTIPFFNRLQVRLMLGFFFLGFVPLTIALMYAYVQARQGFEEQVGLNVAGVAHVVKSRTSQAINVADQQLAIWASQSDAQNAPRVYGETMSIFALLQKRFRSFLVGQRDLLPIFSSIVCVRPEEETKNGKRAAHTLFASDVKHEDRTIYDDFFVVDESGAAHLNDQYRWDSSGNAKGTLGASPFNQSKKVLPIARQYKDVDGNVVALLGLIDWSEIQRLIEEMAVGGQKLSELAKSQDTYVALLDNNGHSLGGTAPADLDLKSLAPLLTKLSASQTSSARINIPGIGDAIVGVEASAESGLNVVAIRHATAAMAPIRRLRDTNLIGALVLLVVMMGLSLRVTAYMTSPLKRLVEGTQIAAGGNLEHTIDIKSRDEVGELALSFNVMVHRLRDSFKQLGAQNEDLKRLDKLKDEFLANTSHELRTPINGLMGLIGAVLEGAYGDVNPGLIPTLQMAQNSANRLATLVNSILDFSASRQEEGLKISQFDLKKMIEQDLQPIFIGINRKKALNLTFEFPPDLPLIYADEEKIRQILMNLGGNALKFTHKGAVSIRTTYDAANKMVSVAVTDSGIGISEKDLKVIFEPFRQAEGSAVREFEGTGLGLAIVKTNAERHGGRIRVSSELGKGSTFTLDLPIDARNAAQQGVMADAEPVVVTESVKSQPEPVAQVAHPVLPAPVAQAPVAPDPRPSGPVFTRTTTHDIPVAQFSALGSSKVGGGKEQLMLDSPAVATPDAAVRGGQGELIWVIDDEPVNIEVIRARLEMHNYRVLGLGSAVTALEELSRAQQLPDLILLDIMMPLMSGFEFCERLKHRAEWASIPIIMVSAKSQLVDKIYGLNLGAIDYMTKPFQKAELLSKIRTFLDLRVGQRMRAELEMASAIQSMLISGERFRGTACEWAGRVTACTETGGDWFGVLDHPDSTVTTSIVADVSGHGAPAALVTGLLHGFFSATRRQLTEPDPEVWKAQVAEALKSLNQTILASTHRKLVQSMLLWSFDHKTRKARFVNAGHPHPVILRGQAANGKPHVETLLSPPSSLLGDVEDPKFSWGEAQFAPTDCFVVYTDGLVECTNVASKPYGAKRLHQVLSRGAKLSAEQLRDTVLEDASSFYGSTPRSDDVTVLVGRVL